MFYYNALSQYVYAYSENWNYVNSMDPESANMLGVKEYDQSEDNVDLQKSMLLYGDNQEYVDEAIKIDRFMTNEEICQVALDLMRE